VVNTLFILLQYLVASQNVPPTKGELSMNFIWSGQGSSQDGALSYNISDNFGEMTIRGEKYVTVAYFTQLMGWPNPPGTVRWIDLVGISESNNNLAVIYVGCNPPPNTKEITILWEEDYTHFLTEFTPGTKECNFTDLANKPNFNFSVELPALAGIPTRGINTGITIKGDLVVLNEDSGWLEIDSTNYSITPITYVDCSTCGANCHTCQRSPWYELHFIYSSVQEEEIGFGIFYIYPYNRTFVQFNYTLTFPTLSSPQITYQATWTGSIPSFRPSTLPVISNKLSQDDE